MALIPTKRVPLNFPRIVSPIAFSPNKRKVAFVIDSDSLVKYDLDTDEFETDDARFGLMSRYYGIVWHPNGKIYLLGLHQLHATVAVTIYDDRGHKEGISGLSRQYPGEFNTRFECRMSLDRDYNIVITTIETTMMVVRRFTSDCCSMIDRHGPDVPTKEIHTWKTQSFDLYFDTFGNMLWPRDPKPGLHCYNLDTRSTSVIMTDTVYERIIPLRSGAVAVMDVGHNLIFLDDHLTCTKKWRVAGDLRHSVLLDDCNGAFHRYDRLDTELRMMEYHDRWSPHMHKFGTGWMNRIATQLMFLWWSSTHHGGALSMVPIELVFEVINVMWLSGLRGIDRFSE